MRDPAGFLLAIGLAGAAIGLLIFVIFMFMEQPKALTAETGRIGPSRLGTWFLLVLSVAYAALSLIVLILGGGASLLSGVALGFVFTIWNAAYLTQAYDIVWDATGFSGPGSLWFPPFGPQRTHIQWEEAAAMGDWPRWGFYIAGRDGRKIWLGFGWPGGSAFLRRTHTLCPNLTWRRRPFGRQ